MTTRLYRVLRPIFVKDGPPVFTGNDGRTTQFFRVVDWEVLGYAEDMADAVAQFGRYPDASPVLELMSREESDWIREMGDVPPEPGLVRNLNHRASEEGTFACTCKSYPHASWCGEWVAPLTGSVNGQLQNYLYLFEGKEPQS